MKHPSSSPAIASKLGRLVAPLGLASAFVAPGAWADGLRELDQTIFGMDCAPCAAGVEQGLRKLDGVTSVRVSLNEGKALVTLAPESRTTLAQIREVIRHNGFTPKDARATLVGRVMRQGDRWWIDTGSGRFVLDADRATLQGQTAAQEAGGDVQLIVRIPESLSNPPTIQLLSAVTPAR
jgi:copper chaperone CopZ